MCCANQAGLPSLEEVPVHHSFEAACCCCSFELESCLRSPEVAMTDSVVVKLVAARACCCLSGPPCCCELKSDCSPGLNDYPDLDCTA